MIKLKKNKLKTTFKFECKIFLRQIHLRKVKYEPKTEQIFGL